MTAEHTCKCSPARPGVNPRNLVVCIDGTSNRFGAKNTNIVELYSHIVKSDEQLTYYSSGLGAIPKVAEPPLGRRFSNEIDMAVGRNLQKVIMTAYRWLSDYYRDGDKIYLFGFSRGAYQVRALAGMIARVGLILPGNNEQIPFAFDVYSKINDDNSGTLEQGPLGSFRTKRFTKQNNHVELAETFKRTFSRKDVRVHFLGAWDTVSSVGFGRGDMLPSTISSCDHICFFRHALALDERRVKFLPEYVYGGRAHPFHDNHVKEVWFAGSHSDYLQSGDIPLLWMRSQAMAAGLQLEAADVRWKISDLEKPITPSLKPGWWFLELLPIKRLLYYNSNRITNKCVGKAPPTRSKI
ncbi:hypothetical protein F5I97DRAFT_1818595 [Phlebopus sp. FC_14]|nr:hypothetical protein F5I97DRAFT_1818595 [Phlebopus sp. FC_14]